MLVIEIDGISHTWEDVAVNDEIRQRKIESLGIQFLRFDDKEIKQNMSFVLNTIHDWIVEYEKIPT